MNYSSCCAIELIRQLICTDNKTQLAFYISELIES